MRDPCFPRPFRFSGDIHSFPGGHSLFLGHSVFRGTFPLSGCLFLSWLELSPGMSPFYKNRIFFECFKIDSGMAKILACWWILIPRNLLVISLVSIWLVLTDLTTQGVYLSTLYQRQEWIESYRKIPLYSSVFVCVRTMACWSSLTWPSLFGVWGWVSLHTCCTLSNQCAQVKPAITHIQPPAWQHGAPGHLFYLQTLQ